MQTIYGLMVSFFLLASIGIGCSDNDDDGSGAAGATDAGGTTVDVGATGSETVSVTGLVLEAPNFTPYAGAVGCVLDSDPTECAESGDDGTFQIDLPANSMTGVTFEIPEMIPFLNPIATGDTDINLTERGGWKSSAINVVVPHTPNLYDPAKGQADFIATRINGGSVTTDGTDTEGWWLDDFQTVGTDGEMSTSDLVLHGFNDLDPGMITFWAKKDGKPCEWDPVVWPGDEPGTITVPIRAGWWTRLFEVVCP